MKLLSNFRSLRMSSTKNVNATVIGLVVLYIMVANGASLGINCQTACETGSVQMRSRCACPSVGNIQSRRKRTPDYDFLFDTGTYSNHGAHQEEPEEQQYTQLFRWGRSGPPVFRWGKRSDAAIPARARPDDVHVSPWSKRDGTSSVFRSGRGGGGTSVFKWGKREKTDGPARAVFRWGKRNNIGEQTKYHLFRLGESDRNDLLRRGLQRLAQIDK